MERTVLVISAFLVFFVAYSSQYSTGAPPETCMSMTPEHNTTSQPIPGGFYLYSDLIDDGGNYTASTPYIIKLEGPTYFEGFLIQARTSGTTTPIGSFSTPSGTRHLSCSGASAASVTHTDESHRDSLTFTWTSPPGNGAVEFHYSVVRSFSTYYANINAADNRPPSPSSTSDVATSTPIPAPTSTPSSCPSTNNNADSLYSIVFREPDGCDRANCDYYWAMGPNNEDSSYVDIYLEGNINDGWIAAGFSQNKMMPMTDVLGCRVVSGSVEVIDSWNENYQNNIDSTQDGLCTHMTSYDGTRIQCLFSRISAALDSDEDFDLDSSLYIIRGYRTSVNSGSSFSKHSTTPRVSSEQYNVLKDSNTGTTFAPTAQPGCPLAPASDARYPTSLNAPGDDYYFGARVNDDNSSFLDITLEGVADGWVAVGFTESFNMFSADVFGCKRESSSDDVNVIDTWNPSSPRTNVLDNTQSGICQHSTEYTNGRIRCTFSRLIEPSDAGQDLDLNSTLYQIYNAIGSGRGPSDTALGVHSRVPILSENRMSLATDALAGRILSATEWPKKPLIQTHGIFMVVSWIVLAATGIFYASWMKPTLPNGEWFQVHRALMIGSLVTGVIGFIFAFIAHARNTEVAGIMNFSEPNRGLKITHFVFGWIIILFHIANPIIAIFRCAPGKPRRWIFNLIHGHLIGLIVLLIAMINVAMGIYLIEKTQASYNTKRTFILYMVFIGLYLLLQLVLFIVYFIKARAAPEQDRPKLVHSLMRYFITGGETKQETKIEMTKADEKKEDPNEKPSRKQPHENAPVVISWISAIGFMSLNLVVVLVIIILIAVL